MALEEIDSDVTASPEAQHGLEGFVGPARSRDAEDDRADGDRTQHNISQSVERELELEPQKAHQQFAI